ncbi:cyanophycin synthetase [Propionivibrio dicarboxylicus]|uniref:Cyanophycin synthetase n=1 Tax=Propionivibrio dicarboxylicus TaxID=83767 RepID=A0A1G8JFC1_9RHOO|nr:cyanophycin synthetase [Propionivibrio dicarboxylicus]SDI29842.1 cyanophycin synthetase [Propionivibrio dicarboxylicus]
MTTKDIKFLEFRLLNGPNTWTYQPALEAIVDIGDLEDCPSNTIPGYYDRLKAMLPSLIEHRCSYEERGGFLRRVEEGTWPAHILEHVTLELQNLAGLPGGFGRARETSKRGVYKVVVTAWQEQVTHTAIHEARDLIMAAMEDRPFDVDAAVERIADLVDSLCLGPSTASIVKAADDRGIPTIRLLETGNLVQIGYGAAMRRIWTAETDQTSAIAEGISRDKDLTKALLSNCGVPVPEGREVDSPEDAWEAAEDVGLPVCVKPLDGNHGRGVFIDLKTREDVEKAYMVAKDEGSGVLVERSISGTEHRLLVIGGKLVAACRGDMVKVTGDGQSTVVELVASQINNDPRRGTSENHPLNLIRMDSAARIELQRQQLTPDSIPAAGREVLIQRNANHEFDVTDDVHPDTAAIAELAARIVGLDIAGIDMVADDISRPLAEQGGAIVEVNAGPGLLMHLKPGVGKPRPVGEAIVAHLFPDAAMSRIPLVGVTGSQGKTAVAHLVRHLLLLAGKNVGLACSDGLYLGRRQLDRKDCANWTAAHQMLMSRAVDAAVFENGVAGILENGLAYDRCQIGIVTNLNDATGLQAWDVHDLDQVFKVMRTQVDVVLDSGAAILNADDPRVAEMADLSDGEVLFFGRNPELELLGEHRKKNGRCVFVRHGWVILAHGMNEQSLVQTGDVPMLAAGTPAHAVDNLLAAVAAAWALDLPPDLIRTGITTFIPADSTQA